MAEKRTARQTTPRRLRLAGALGVLALVTSCRVGAAAVSAETLMRVPAASSAWGKAQEAPGTGALNTGKDASLNEISCASAGNCSAGGYYSSSPDKYRAFVESEVRGVWKKAIEVRGTGALNSGGEAGLYSISCPSIGHCSAGGSYENIRGYQAFVVSTSPSAADTDRSGSPV